MILTIDGKTIEVKTGQTLHARIMLPEGVHATLEWKGQCVEVEHSQELVIAE